MTSIAVVARLIRYCFGPFLLNTTYAVAVYFVAPIILGLATQSFFNAVIGSSHLNTWGAIAVLTVLLAGQAVAAPVLGSPWSPLQQKAIALMRANLFAAVLRSYGRTGLPISAGESVSRFRDDPMIVADALDAVSDLIGRSLFAIGAAVLMWRISPLITLVLFVPLLLSSLIVEALEGRIMAYRNASRAAGGVVTAFLADILAGQLALRVAGAGPRAVARLADLGDARRKAEVRDAVLGGMLDAFNYNLTSVGVGIVLLLSASPIRSGVFSVGDLALFAVFLDALGWYPAEVGRLLSDLKRIDVSMSRMGAMVPNERHSVLVEHRPIDLHAASEAHTSAPSPFSVQPRSSREPLHLLEVVGLTYDHPGVAHGIRDVSFTLQRGTLTVITGRVGSGKSTLLQVLLGLLPRDTGEIRWNGIVIDDPATFFVPPRSAFTPQVPRLFSETLRENLLLGRKSSESGLERAIHTAVLEPDVANLERGLDTLVGARGVRLSGGQIQRAAAARMFLREAELVVFDDLSSALDRGTEAKLWSRLRFGGREQTFVVVSHRPTALQQADQIIALDDGRVVSYEV